MDYEKIFNNLNQVYDFYCTNTDITKRMGIGYLFVKIKMDFDAIQTLLEANVPLEQSFIIGRNLIETAVTFVYLLEFNTEVQEYIEDSQLMLFKNDFIVLKHAIGDKFDIPLPAEEIKKEFETAGFPKLSPRNQKLLLNIIELPEFKLNDETIAKLDKFFKDKFKPTFTKIETMYKAISEKTASVYGTDLRTLTYDDYNICSQVIHNIYPIRTLQLYNILRICTFTSNLLGAALRKKYNIEPPIELRTLILECHEILHPEDKGKFIIK